MLSPFPPPAPCFLKTALLICHKKILVVVSSNFKIKEKKCLLSSEYACFAPLETIFSFKRTFFFSNVSLLYSLNQNDQEMLIRKVKHYSLCLHLL